MNRKLEAAAICLRLSGESDGAKFQTPSGKSQILQTPPAKLSPALIPAAFPLSRSHYVRLMSVETTHVRSHRGPTRDPVAS